jgi:hypothetical protein
MGTGASRLLMLMLSLLPASILLAKLVIVPLPLKGSDICVSLSPLGPSQPLRLSVSAGEPYLVIGVTSHF